MESPGATPCIRLYTCRFLARPGGSLGSLRSYQSLVLGSSFHSIVGIMSDHPNASQIGDLYRECGVESSTNTLVAPCVVSALGLN
jgi:hypothetical protein